MILRMEGNKVRPSGGSSAALDGLIFVCRSEAAKADFGKNEK